MRHVVVGGRPVVRDGRLITLDERALNDDVERWSGHWAKQVKPVERWADRLAPAYEEVYARCAAADVGVNRWVPDGVSGSEARR